MMTLGSVIIQTHADAWSTVIRHQRVNVVMVELQTRWSVLVLAQTRGVKLTASMIGMESSLNVEMVELILILSAPMMDSAA